MAAKLFQPRSVGNLGTPSWAVLHGVAKRETRLQSGLLPERPQQHAGLHIRQAQCWEAQDWRVLRMGQPWGLGI